MNNKFDELAKGLAPSTTRRQAFKQFAAGVAGKKCNSKVLTGLAVLVAWSITAAPAQFSFTTLDDPLAVTATSSGTLPYGISSNRIVGVYDGSDGRPHGFLYNGSEWLGLDDLAPPGFSTPIPFGIQGANIVGHYFNTNNETDQGFLYDGSTWTTLDDPLLGIIFPTGIDGTNIVGNYNSGYIHGFLYNGQTWATLDDPLAYEATAPFGISGTNIVGWYEDKNTLNATGFLYDGSTYTALIHPLAQGPQDQTGAFGISTDNIVGYYRNTMGTFGFLYKSGTWMTLSHPHAGLRGTVATGISGDNIVGYYYDSKEAIHGFLAVPKSKK